MSPKYMNFAIFKRILIDKPISMVNIDGVNRQVDQIIASNKIVSYRLHRYSRLHRD